MFIEFWKPENTHNTVLIEEKQVTTHAHARTPTTHRKTVIGQRKPRGGGNARAVPVGFKRPQKRFPLIRKAQKNVKITFRIFSTRPRYYIRCYGLWGLKNLGTNSRGAAYMCITRTKENRCRWMFESVFIIFDCSLYSSYRLRNDYYILL